MRFFKRGAAAPQDGDFWAWWAGARDRVANAIETGGFDEKLVSEVSRAVASIDPRMAWEFARGTCAKHALCVSPRTTEPGARVIHLVAEDLDRVRAGIDAWAEKLPPWRIKVDFQQDPGWEFQRELGVR